MASTTIRVSAATKRLLERLHEEGRRSDAKLTQQDLVDRALRLASRHKDELFEDKPSMTPEEFNAWLDGIAGDYGDLTSNIDEIVYGG